MSVLSTSGIYHAVSQGLWLYSPPHVSIMQSVRGYVCTLHLRYLSCSQSGAMSVLSTSGIYHAVSQGLWLYSPPHVSIMQSVRGYVCILQLRYLSCSQSGGYVCTLHLRYLSCSQSGGYVCTLHLMYLSCSQSGTMTVLSTSCIYHAVSQGLCLYSPPHVSLMQSVRGYDCTLYLKYPLVTNTAASFLVYWNYSCYI